MKYIYNDHGSAAGFISGHYIHDMRGHAVGQISSGTNVHLLRG